LQILSQGSGRWFDDQLNLDIHAINELQEQGVPRTNDLPKYDYHASSEDKDADYGKSELQLYSICDILCKHKDI
jgi:alanyl-tRNA synthetase